MTQSQDQKSVLILGLQPELLDFSHPDYAAFPGLTAAKVQAGLNAAKDNLVQQGYAVELLLTDMGETAEAVVRDALARHRFDAVLIGAGLRTIPGNFFLFEQLLNVVHEGAPDAKLCFNTIPTDTVQAVQRWI